MKLGISLPAAGAWASPESLVRVARHAEELGYHSLWVFQRLLYALEPKQHYAAAPNQPWPKAFERVLDPIVALSYVAAATTRIRLGTSVLIMPYYSPLLLARQLATLDVVSGGRLHVGLGIGWSEDEYDASGIPYRQRGRRAEEFLRCLKAIWTQDVVEFRGAFYRVPRSKVEPKPVQKPHPPLTLGGHAPAVIRRSATLADGYNGTNMPFDRVTTVRKELAATAEAAGRRADGLHLVARGAFQVHDAPQGKDRKPLRGTIEEIREDIRRYAEAGLGELFLESNFSPPPKVEALLDVMTRLAPVLGEI